MSSPKGPATHRNVHLLRELIRRDFSARFTGSALGLAWAVLQPLSLVILYWFVFSVMIPRAPSPGDDHYIEFLIAGLIPWLAINEGILRATTSIVDNAPMVRKLSFRSELLVVVPNATAVLFECVALFLFVAFCLARGLSPRALWLLPIAIILQFSIQVGVGMVLAAVYVFFRDLTQIIGFVLSIFFYLSPILYPVTGRFARFFAWNPMTPLLGLFRGAILQGALPDIGSIVFLLIFASAVLASGLAFFRRAQPALVDLI